MKNRQDMRDTAYYWPPLPANDSKNIQTSLFKINTKELHLHYHETMEVGVCLHGEGVLYTATQTFPFTPGDVQIIFPYVKHISLAKPDDICQWYFSELRIPELLKHINCTLSSELYHLLHKQGSVSGIFSKDFYPELADCVNIIITESLSNQEGFEKICATAVLELLYRIRRISSHEQDAEMKSYVHNADYQKIQPALLYLAEHIHISVSSAKLAKLCYMSETNFRLLFKRVTGLSPKQYILNLVMSQCEHHLMNTNLPIEEISHELGFSDTSGLYRLFKRIHGVSPATFRANAR